ncbi:MAG: carph-isopro domain-containing protein [Gemmatimonadota bacterium]
MKFDLDSLIADLGGARAVAERIGVGRTVPYGWKRRGTISSTSLSKIKRSWPDLDLDRYFTEERPDERARDAGGGA